MGTHNRSISLLRRLRSDAGFSTTTEFSKYTGVNLRTVSAHELGTRAIHEKYAKIYSEALKVDDWKVLITSDHVELVKFIEAYNKEIELIVYLSTCLAELRNVNIKAKMEILSSMVSDEKIVSQYYNSDIEDNSIIRKAANLLSKDIG